MSYPDTLASQLEQHLLTSHPNLNLTTLADFQNWIRTSLVTADISLTNLDPTQTGKLMRRVMRNMMTARGASDTNPQVKITINNGLAQFDTKIEVKNPRILNGGFGVPPETVASLAMLDCPSLHQKLPMPIYPPD